MQRLDACTGNKISLENFQHSDCHLTSRKYCTYLYNLIFYLACLNKGSTYRFNTFQTYPPLFRFKLCHLSLIFKRAKICRWISIISLSTIYSEIIYNITLSNKRQYSLPRELLWEDIHTTENLSLLTAIINTQKGGESTKLFIFTKLYLLQICHVTAAKFGMSEQQKNVITFI